MNFQCLADITLKNLNTTADGVVGKTPMAEYANTMPLKAISNTISYPESGYGYEDEPSILWAPNAKIASMLVLNFSILIE